ncbi:hypothetical protein [Sphingomonas soli]|uniref:hypothetical protein n=1 Tax=Sphingomonas soli TaxID=266127 RepID=UPI000832292E|nr:hypothetical protein [Sphingomonas soli]
MIRALVRQLVRKGDLDADDIDAIAADLDARNEATAAHMARASFVEGLAPSQSEWEAERSGRRIDERRARLHVVPADGGKAHD